MATSLKGVAKCNYIVLYGGISLFSAHTVFGQYAPDSLPIGEQFWGLIIDLGCSAHQTLLMAVDKRRLNTVTIRTFHDLSVC